jgi:hypothetical protein
VRRVFVVSAALGVACAIACESRYYANDAPDAGDAATDSSGDDAPVANDGGADSALDADAGPPACDETADATNTFCETFDHVDAASDLAARWGGAPTTVGGATFDVVSSTFLSPPHAALLTTPAADGGLSPFEAYVAHDIPASGAVRTMTCDFDILLDAPDLTPSAFARIFSVVLTPPSGPAATAASALLYLEGGGTLTFYTHGLQTDGGSNPGYAKVGKLTPKAWWHVRVALRADGIETSFSSASMLGVIVKVDTVAPPQVSLATLTLGFVDVGTTTGWRVAFDNLSCTLTP